MKFSALIFGSKGELRKESQGSLAMDPRFSSNPLIIRVPFVLLFSFNMETPKSKGNVYLPRHPASGRSDPFKNPLYTLICRHASAWADPPAPPPWYAWSNIYRPKYILWLTIYTMTGFTFCVHVIGFCGGL